MPQLLHYLNVDKNTTLSTAGPADGEKSVQQQGGEKSSKAFVNKSEKVDDVQYVQNVVLQPFVIQCLLLHRTSTGAPSTSSPVALVAAAQSPLL
jgi:hypothetical protein